MEYLLYDALLLRLIQRSGHIHFNILCNIIAPLFSYLNLKRQMNEYLF